MFLFQTNFLRHFFSFLEHLSAVFLQFSENLDQMFNNIESFNWNIKTDRDKP